MKSILKSRKVMLGFAIILLAVTSIITGIVVRSSNPAVRVKKNLTLGEKYLSEIKYEKALVVFKEVIDIEPRNVTAYLGVADAYIGLEQPEEAIVWLEKGIDEIETYYAESGEIEKDSEKLYLKDAENLEDLGEYQRVADILERGYKLTGDETIQGRMDEINKLLIVEASLKEGTYYGPQHLYLSSMGERIYYTIDGSTPNGESLSYEEPILIESGTTVIKAVAVDEIGELGEVFSFSYLVDSEENRIEKEDTEDVNEEVTEDIPENNEYVEHIDNNQSEDIQEIVSEETGEADAVVALPTTEVTKAPVITPIPVQNNQETVTEPTAAPTPIVNIKPTATPTPSVLKEPVLAKESDFTYSLSSGQVTISKYVGDGGNIIIPKTLGGGEVKKIGPAAFRDCASLIGVEIPSTVEEIGNVAFKGCKGLTSIRIPATVTKWGNNVFFDTNIKTATFDEGITVIPGALSGCTTLEKVILPNNVKEIGAQAFSGCIKLKDLTIPTEVKKIGQAAFLNCASLTGVEIPSTVEEIGNVAFKGCKGLTSIRIPATVTKWGNNVFFDTNIKTATFDEGITVIPGALSGCTTLEKVILPNSVKEIGAQAFSGCIKLKDLTIPTEVKKIGQAAFLNCASLTGVEIPSTVEEIGNVAFKGCKGLTSIRIPATVTKWGNNVFFDTNIKTATFDEGIAVIPSALTGCTTLEKVILPNNVKEIGAQAFSGCIKLKDLTIPTEVKKIGPAAFRDCASLIGVDIPSSVEEIGNSAFYGCNNLKVVTFQGNTPKLGSDTFPSHLGIK